MITTLASIFFGGVVSALVTLFAGQPLLHYFWIRQRQEERQIAIIDQVAQLAAQFHYHCMEYFYSDDPDQDSEEFRRSRRFRLTDAFFEAFDAAGSQVRVLFSASAFQAFTQMEQWIGPRRQNEQLAERSKNFIAAREATLRALYHDMDIPAPSFGQWLKAQLWRERGHGVGD
jgi:hypothetical protein